MQVPAGLADIGVRQQGGRAMLGCPFRGMVQSGTPPQRDPVRHAQRPTRRRGPRTPRAPDPPLYRSPRRQPHPVVTPDPQLVAGWRRLPQPRARHERPQNQRRGLMRHRTTSLTNTVARVAWILRLVEAGAGGDDRSTDVMEI